MRLRLKLPQQRRRMQRRPRLQLQLQGSPGLVHGDLLNMRLSEAAHCKQRLQLHVTVRPDCLHHFPLQCQPELLRMRAYCRLQEQSPRCCWNPQCTASADNACTAAACGS